VRVLCLALIAAALAATGCSANGGFPNEGANSSGSGVGTGGDGSNGFFAGSAEWCAVETILEAHCQTCHNANLAFGAPMPLLTHTDMIAPTPIDGRPAYRVALDRVTATAKPMPPPPRGPLGGGDIATLRAWVDAGTPYGNCDAPVMGGSGSNNGGGSNFGGSGNVGGTNVGGGGSNFGGGGNVGGTGNVGGNTPIDYPPDCIDCGDYACTEGTPVAFRAHESAVAGDTQPFDAGVVGTNGNANSYECFYFEAPWGATTQLLGHRPIVDNERVLHHWLLYASNTPPPDLQNGGRRSYCQFQPDSNRVLLAGWAPGTPGTNLPPNVGQALPHGDRVFITLEIHYFNTQPGTPALDRSGVEVCLTDTPRQHEASMHWLGTENINIGPNAQATAADTCTPNQGQTATILRIWPHMHLTGTHAKLDVVRAGGARENIHDRGFSFDNQTMFDLPQPVVVNPGDRLETTCTFQNNAPRLINFGEGSDEEMCYIFTLAYPAGSLHNGRNGCLPGLGCVPGGIRRCIDNENILTAIGGL
jgi:hypothetical protein